MSGFTKLFSSIVTSSLWCQDDTTLRVWIGMLATAGPTGIVPGSVPGLASLCRVSIQDMERVLEVLMSPDPYSRTPDHDGRRVAKCDGGWQLLNYQKYRGMRDEDARKEYQREWVKEKRSRQKVSTVDHSRPQSPQAEAEAEAEKITTPLPPKGEPAKPARRKRGEALGLAVLDMNPEELSAWERFEEAYPAQGWNFSTRSASPRKRNAAEAAHRFRRVCREAPIAGEDGRRITPEYLVDAALAWIARRRAEAPGSPPCVPNIENFWQLAEGQTRHWQNALLDYSRRTA